MTYTIEVMKAGSFQIVCFNPRPVTFNLVLTGSDR